MTEDEKKLLQAKHRLEEAEARNRVRERKARTRRLIQEGAVLEKVFPQIVTVELEKLEEFLHSRMRTDFYTGTYFEGVSRSEAPSSPC